MTRGMPNAAKLQVSAGQCEHAIDTTSMVVEYRLRTAAEQGRDPHRCLCDSAYTLDGRFYCARHAGMVILTMAVRSTKETLVERLRAWPAGEGDNLSAQEVAALFLQAADAISTSAGGADA